MPGWQAYHWIHHNCFLPYPFQSAEHESNHSCTILNASEPAKLSYVWKYRAKQFYGKIMKMLFLTSYNGKNILIHVSSNINVFFFFPDLSGVSPSIVVNRAIVKSFRVVIFAVNKVAYCINKETCGGEIPYSLTVVGPRLTSCCCLLMNWKCITLNWTLFFVNALYYKYL
jgi:hypothetical protein